MAEHDITMEGSDHGWPAVLHFSIQGAEYNPPDRSVGQHYGWWDGWAKLSHATVLGVKVPVEAIVMAEGAGWVERREKEAFREWEAGMLSPRAEAACRRADEGRAAA